MSELKPCPFCGGTNIEPHGSEFRCWYECPDCGCIEGMHNSRQQAIEAWNTRAERTCTIEGVEYDDLLEEFSFDLSCGHKYWSRLSTCPNYCVECGAEVVEYGAEVVS